MAQPAAATAPIPQPDLASPVFKADPYPFYARLRAEAPVYPFMLSRKEKGWLITRYADAVDALKDERLVKNPQNATPPGGKSPAQWVPPLFRPLTRNMLDLDAPDHTRLRALVHKAFTPRFVDQLRGRIQSLTDDLLDAAERDGACDFIRDFALPLPVTVIAEMLGVPAKDQHAFTRWSQAMVAVSSQRDSLRVLLPVWRFIRYVRGLIRHKRDNPGEDLITALLRVEEEGDRLSADELLAMVFILLIAGHETTVNLIGTGMLDLLRHLDQMDMLRQRPEGTKTAIEELVRYSSPVTIGTERYARETMTLHDVTIPLGDLVLVGLSAANRDERQFPRADTLDLTREPNRHLAFGQGSHYCLGAPLARMEGQIAIETVLRRFPDLHLAVDPTTLRWRRSLFLRGLERLPLTLR